MNVIDDLHEDINYKVEESGKHNTYTRHDHLMMWLNRIQTDNSVHISDEDINKIKLLFKQYIDSFNRHKSSSRTSFLSYSFVLRKLFKIIDSTV